MQNPYLGKIKMIYIDPPYNTGNDFVYNDKFVECSDQYLIESNQKSNEGTRLLANLQSNGRFHSSWLSMMYSRLKLCRNLLTEDGVIFISIDDNEVDNLIKLGREIFGDENFVAQIAIQLNPRGRHLDRFIAKTHESIIVFVKDGLNASAIQGLKKDGEMIKQYNRRDQIGPFRLLGLRNRNQSFNPSTRPNLYYPLFVNPEDGSISLSKSSKFSEEVYPNAPDGTQTCWTWGKDRVDSEHNTLVAERKGQDWQIFRKDYLHKNNGEVSKTHAKSLWIEKEISNDRGRAAIKELFGSAVMDFPKSVELIAKMIRMGSGENDIVLDFFAGSSTTAHAVLAVNASDGSSRRFIMVQLNEKSNESSAAKKAGYTTIAELSRERIRLAGDKVLQGKTHPAWNNDVGFRSLKIDTSNMEDVYYTPSQTNQLDLLNAVDNIKPDRTEEDLLFQVLVDWGIDLFLPIVSKSIRGKRVFFVDGNALAACFETGLTEDFVKDLAQFKPNRVLFRDGGFVSDSVKINVEQLFKQLSPVTELKAL